MRRCGSCSPCLSQTAYEAPANVAHACSHSLSTHHTPATNMCSHINICTCQLACTSPAIHTGSSDHQLPRSAFPAAPGSAPPLTYMSRAGSSFTLYSNLYTQAEAQAVCLKQGGHLASFISEAEQYEVESFVSACGAAKAADNLLLECRKAVRGCCLYAGSASMYQCIYVPVHLCTSASMYQCIYVPVHLCTSASMYQCIYVPVHLCTSASMYQCIYVPVHLCTSASMYQCIYAPVHHCSTPTLHTRALPQHRAVHCTVAAHAGSPCACCLLSQRWPARR